MTSRRNFLLSAGAATVGGLVSGSLARASTGYWVAQASGPETPNLRLGFGCVDLSFEPKESTDEIEKTQEVPSQFVKTRK